MSVLTLNMDFRNQENDGNAIFSSKVIFVTLGTLIW